MKQLSFDFHRGLRVGDVVKIVSKSCGGSFCSCKKGKIQLIEIFPDGWVEGCDVRRPPVGTTFYEVDGGYFLRKDLKLLRRGDNETSNHSPRIADCTTDYRGDWD